MQNKEKDTYWFVLVVNHNRLMKAQTFLEGKGITCFVPMKFKHVIRQGQRKRIEVPAIHNLLFVHTRRVILAPYLSEYGNSIHFMYHKVNGSPIVIPQKEMNNFMLVAGTPREDLIYLNDPIEKFAKSDRVRILGGLLEGFEGYVVRIRRDRKVVVSLLDVVAVAVSNIHPSLLMKIDN